MRNFITRIIVVLVAVILFSCSSTATYNFGTEDEYRLGEVLLDAIAKKKNSTVMELINRGAPLNYQDRKDEWSPLVYAIYYENWPIAEFLIRAGVNVNLRDQANRTALMWCAMRGDLTVLRLLIEHGADLGAADVGGRTALHYALSYNHSAAAEYLAKIGKLPTEKRIRAAHSVMAKEPGEKHAVPEAKETTEPESIDTLPDEPQDAITTEEELADTIPEDDTNPTGNE